MPPTPVELQVAALGGSTPGCCGQDGDAQEAPLAVPFGHVHWAPVTEQAPVGRQTGSVPTVVQARPVKLHTPGTLAHGTCELHAACVLAQVPTEEQSDALLHCTVGSLAQVPITVGQFPGLAEHDANGGLLQVPLTVHTRLAAACVAPLHGFCVLHLPVPIPAQSEFFVHGVTRSEQTLRLLQLPGVVGHCAADPQAAPP